MKRLPKKNGLTAQQISFCEQYVVDFNATKAAERAKYSPRTAQEQGSRLLSNVMVQNEIKRLTDKASMDAEVTVKDVVLGLKKRALYDVRKFFDEKGNPREIHELDDETAAGVAGFEFVTLYDGNGEQKHAFGQLRKIRLVDAAQNLERLGRYLGMFKDKLEVTEKNEFAGKTKEELQYFIDHGEWPSESQPGTRVAAQTGSSSKDTEGN